MLPHLEVVSCPLVVRHLGSSAVRLGRGGTKLELGARETRENNPTGMGWSKGGWISPHTATKENLDFHQNRRSLQQPRKREGARMPLPGKSNVNLCERQPLAHNRSSLDRGTSAISSLCHRWEGKQPCRLSKSSLSGSCDSVRELGQDTHRSPGSGRQPPVHGRPQQECGRFEQDLAGG